MTRRRIARVHDDLLHPLGPDGADLPGVPVGSAAWFAWLDAPGHGSFAYAHQHGTFTARRERRHDRQYWYAYRTQRGELHKEYLGLSEALTSSRLAEAAVKLARVPLASGVDPPPERSTSADTAPFPGSVHLLATRLFVPRPRADVVNRPRLLARLDAGLEHGRCTLLSAPAGAGKTSLLAAWLATVSRPVAWLALDERDRDVLQVLRYLVAALQTAAPGCGRTALAWLDAPPPQRTPEVVLVELLNDLAGLADACLLVLDDYHLIRTPAIHQAVAFLLDNLPPTVNLVISTREDPPLPLPRLRARGQLTEVRAADLRFTAEEAASFLGDGMGLSLDDGQVRSLVARTEGWAAGLQLAGLALRERTDPSAFVTTFAGSHRLVADYLTAEVLDLQPAPMRHFLLATGLLDRLCAPLCDALLAPDSGDGERDGPPSAGGDSQDTIEALERANLFLAPLDDERHWYRYHHLFADALRARLAREAGAEAVATIHRRASAWFAHEGLLPEAIEHALAAGAVEDAARWVETLTPTLFANSAIHQTLTAWLAALPEPVVRARPLLCLGHAWLLIHRAQLEGAIAWVEAAERALSIKTTDDPRRARGAVDATRAYLGTRGPTTTPEQARAWAERALANLAPDDATMRVIAGMSLAQAALAQGQPDRAVQAFGAAAATGHAAGLAHIAVISDVYQAAAQRISGARRDALHTVTLDSDAERSAPVARGVGMLAVLRADLLRDGNELAAALPLATEGLRSLRQHVNAPPLILVASLSAAWLHLARGDVEAAAAVLAEARPLVQHGPTVTLASLLDAGEAQIQLARGNLPAAVAWATASEPVALLRLLQFGPHVYAAGVEALGVTAARIMVVQGRATGDAALLGQAADRLDAAFRLAERQGLGWLRLKVLVLQSLIAGALDDRDLALATLSEAIAQAIPEGILRPFVDEREHLAGLLISLRAQARSRREATAGPTTSDLDLLLAACRGHTSESPGSGPAGLVEPLTARERDVLRLLAAGRSNAELARELVVEQSTIKTHLIHLYDKLGVRSRTQAVARASALQLLD
jgi:LuxR family transcriptional regulator, maltose regulon positive regulatory protein